MERDRDRHGERITLANIAFIATRAAYNLRRSRRIQTIHLRSGAFKPAFMCLYRQEAAPTREGSRIGKEAYYHMLRFSF